jgi:hypothetical protein
VRHTLISLLQAVAAVAVVPAGARSFTAIGCRYHVLDATRSWPPSDQPDMAETDITHYAKCIGIEAARSPWLSVRARRPEPDISPVTRLACAVPFVSPL